MSFEYRRLLPELHHKSHYEKISVQNLLVIADDIALPFGILRMRKKGSDGGHNGLTDIIATLNTVEFPRLLAAIARS